MAALQDKRTDDWVSALSTTTLSGTLANMLRDSGLKCSGEEAREWTVLPKEEPCSLHSMPAKHAKEEEAPSVIPRGSVIQQHITKVASIATRPTAAQTVDPVSDGSSLLHWLTSTATKSTATQTSDPVAGGRSLLQWRSTQGKYWLELKRVQHCIQQTLGQSRDPSRRLTARSPTAVLEQLRNHILHISHDMHAFNRSCCVEMATSSAPSASRRAAVRLRASQTRLPRLRRKGGAGHSGGGGGGGLRSGPAATQLRSHLGPTKSTHGGSAGR